MEDPKCENCGKILENSLYTHCSDKCIFESIKNSKPFDAEGSKDSSTTTGIS